MITGNRIKELRKKEKLSTKILGEIIGMSQQYVSDIETGRAAPSVKTLNKLANYFNVPIDYLLGKTDDPNKYDTEEMIRHFLYFKQNEPEKYEILKQRMPEVDEQLERLIYNYNHTILAKQRMIELEKEMAEHGVDVETIKAGIEVEDLIDKSKRKGLLSIGGEIELDGIEPERTILNKELKSLIKDLNIGEVNALKNILQSGLSLEELSKVIESLRALKK